MNPEFLPRARRSPTSCAPTGSCSAASTTRTLDVLAELYAAFAGVPTWSAPTPRTAEMIKYASNALLATLISFSNEIGNLCADGRASTSSRSWRACTSTSASRRSSPTAAGCGRRRSRLPRGRLRLRRQLLPEGRQGADRLRRGRRQPHGRAALGHRVNEAQPERDARHAAAALPDLEGRRSPCSAWPSSPGPTTSASRPALPVTRALLDARRDRHGPTTRSPTTRPRRCSGPGRVPRHPGRGGRGRRRHPGHDPLGASSRRCRRSCGEDLPPRRSSSTAGGCSPRTPFARYEAIGLRAMDSLPDPSRTEIET